MRLSLSVKPKTHKKHVELQARLSFSISAKGLDMTKASLQSRKQQFVRDAIFDAAVEKFAAEGFDDTTVEDVARAAGVSRASFFVILRVRTTCLRKT